MGILKVKAGQVEIWTSRKKTLLLSLLNVCACVSGAVLLLTVSVLTRCDMAVSSDK